MSEREPKTMLPTVEAVPLNGRRVRLRPVEPEDYRFLYRICTSPDVSFRWRFGAGSISFETFAAALWEGVHLQYLIERLSVGKCAGLHQAYNTNFRDGYTFIATILAPECQRSIWPVEGGQLFVDYLFRTFGFRKIYGETVEFNQTQFATGFDRMFVEEAHLRKEHFFDGRYWDKRIHALYPATWYGVDFFSRPPEVDRNAMRGSQARGLSTQ
jgi:RimJ/RimL family protein N-acetyltransferase